MKSNVNKGTVISSLIWKVLERGGTQGVQFVVQLLLARLLTPEDFGMIAIVQVFIAIANVFVISGFSTALIQKKDSDEVDFSSVFYFSVFVSFILYWIIFLFAPFVANFYGNVSITLILRVLSLNLFSGALNSVQNSYIAKHMLFRKQFMSSLVAGLFSGAIGVGLAFSGFGVWALVFQQLINHFTISVTLWFSVNWRPKLIFSIVRIKELFSFGSNLLLSSLIDTIYNNLRTLFIGRMFTADTLGYHNKGRSVPYVITTSLNMAIQSVMLPTFSEYQHDKPRLKQIVRRSMMTGSFLVFPMMIGLAAIAQPLVVLILTEKWLPAVPFIQIYAISMMLLPVNTTNLQAINAIGRSDIFLKLEILKKAIGIGILLISLPFGVTMIALSSIVSTLISAFINAYPNRKILRYGYREQIIDIMPTFTISVIMGIVVYLINFLNIVIWLKLILQVIVGIAIYIGLSKLFKVDIYNYLIMTTKDFIKARKK